jgi:5-dehydro-4-deoxyglucarate dehydratase
MLTDLRTRLSEGVLAFPVTPFTQNLALDEGALAAHVAKLAAAKPVALVPAGGAGELFSLSVAVVVQMTTRHAGATPVIAGVGGSVMIAIEMAQAAEKAGAIAVLLLPPYLITPDQAGLAAYVEAICRAIGIGVIVYSRDNGVFAVETVLRLVTACPNLIGLKDGTGDFETLSSIRRELADRLVIINGRRQKFSRANVLPSASVRTVRRSSLFCPRLPTGSLTRCVTAKRRRQRP